MSLTPTRLSTKGLPLQLDHVECRAFEPERIVCVFITAGPSTKLLRARAGGGLEDMCYDRRRAEACVD